MKKILKPAIAFALTVSLGLVLFFTYVQRPVSVPRYQEVLESYKSSEAVLLDRHGEVIHELRVDDRGRRLDWVSIKAISPALIKAVVLSEDKRFYEHGGFDWRAAVSAFFENLISKNIRGASTITMQLASQIKDGPHPRGRKSVLQKLRQIRQAVSIERNWSKDEILEAYLNLVTFRGELQGLSAASKGLFGKEAHGLTDIESIILASLIRAPNAKAEDIAKRSFQVGKAMGLNLTEESIGSRLNEILTTPRFPETSASIAPHVAVRLLKPGQESKVKTTLDARLQEYAVEVLKQHLTYVSSQNVNDGAVLVVENRTGDVLAYVGSSGALSEAKFVDGVVAKRQAGSTLKPFLYAVAFEKRLLTAASIIDDSPLDLPVVGGLYRPQNYDSTFKGLVTARTSLASSLNVPAVKTLNLVGNTNFLKTLRALGISGLEDDDEYYGPSLALGSADVTLWELVNSYRTLANGGAWSELTLIPENRGGQIRRILSNEATFIVTDILSDREARSQTFGLENPLSTRFRSAVKTGTSKDMRDNWCIGFTDKYTVGVWVGNFSGEPMWNVSGITGAAPVWIEIMNWLHKSADRWSHEPPSGVASKKIDFGSIETARLEWFIKGTEPGDRVEPIREEKMTKILYPMNGTIIALDPDIPEDQQAIFFETERGSSNLTWSLNGESVGAGSMLMWHPEVGRYHLSLLNNEGLVIDQVSFEVRGRAAARE